jgi:hypothetical protein
MGTLRVLNGSGDRRVSWSVEGLVQGDPEAQEAVRQAESIFALERQRGAHAFRVRPDAPAELLEAFDPLAEDTVLIPPMVGG